MTTLELAPAAWRWAPPFTRTNGDIAAHVGEQVGLPPDPDQRWLLDGIFAEEAAEDVPAAFEVCVVSPRQNLKTAALIVAALTDLFVFRVPLHIWTAHEFDTSQKAFEDMVRRIDGCDDFRRRCRKPRTSHGDEAIELLTGERIEFHARTGSAGRGVTGTRLTLDEWLYGRPKDTGALMPTLVTRRDAQVRYGSSAGLAQSEMLRRLRDRGRAGGDPSLVYVEYAAEHRDCEESPCAHGLDAVGCALDDRELWWQANGPALRSGRITEDAIAKQRRAIPPEEFGREFLSWWDDPAFAPPVFGPGKWEACATTGRLDGLALGGLGVAVSFDLKRAAIVGAAQDSDGRMHVKPLQYGPGSGWTVGRLKELQDQYDVNVAIDGRGPGAVLIPSLEQAGVRLTVATTSDVMDACAGMWDLVNEKRVQHGGYPELDAAVSSAVKRPVGDRWAWGRKASSADISPLEAATLAAWAVAEKPTEVWGFFT